MDRKKSVFVWFLSTFKEFIADSAANSEYKILDLYECPKTGFIKAQIQLSGRHIIEKNISDIVTHASLLEGLDKKTIRTLTYMATVERMKPDYSIVVQQLGSEVDDYILEIKSRANHISRKSLSEMSKDKSLLSKLSPLDAHKVGYLAGIKETVREFKLKRSKVDTK